MSAVLEKAQTFEDYLVMPDAEIAKRIEAAREMLGPRVVILGHHYQRDGVIRHPDLTGDSDQMSTLARQNVFPPTNWASPAVSSGRGFCPFRQSR